MTVERAREAMATLEDVFIRETGDAVVISELRKERKGWMAEVAGANFTGEVFLSELQAREEASP